MSIERGTEITIGESLCRENNYWDVVGLRGKVMEFVNMNHNGHRLYRVAVRGRGRYEEWYIYEEDCLPVAPKTNKEALGLLKKEL